MKSLNHLICKNSILLIILLLTHAKSANISISTGVYDFTSDVGNDFYRAAASGRVSLEFIEKSGFSFGTNAGVSFIKVPYNNDTHLFLMFPLILYGKYTFNSRKLRIDPYFAVGIGGYFKIDDNVWLIESTKTITYGYSFTSGIKRPFNEKLSLIVDIGIHFLMSPTVEDINTSGIQSMIGLIYTFRKAMNKK